jgi:hypothetical protein
MAINYNAKAVFRGGHLVSWPAVPNGQQGIGWSVGPFTVISAQVTGTFGAAGSVAIEGSMDNVNWGALHNPQGTAIAVTAAGAVRVMEVPLYIRPNVTAGDGTTALTVQVLAVGGFV